MTGRERTMEPILTSVFIECKLRCVKDWPLDADPFEVFYSILVAGLAGTAHARADAAGHALLDGHLTGDTSFPREAGNGSEHRLWPAGINNDFTVSSGAELLLQEVGYRSSVSGAAVVGGDLDRRAEVRKSLLQAQGSRRSRPEQDSDTFGWATLRQFRSEEREGCDSHTASHENGVGSDLDGKTVSQGTKYFEKLPLLSLGKHSGPFAHNVEKKPDAAAINFAETERAAEEILPRRTQQPCHEKLPWTSLSGNLLALEADPEINLRNFLF